jgi:hypothetical protein
VATLGRVEDRLVAVEAKLDEVLRLLRPLAEERESRASSMGCCGFDEPPHPPGFNSFETASLSGVVFDPPEEGVTRAVIPPHWMHPYPPGLESTGVVRTVAEGYRSG